MSHWASNETKTANFGDKRLNDRMETLLKQLGDKSTMSIPTACGGWAETLAAYRFFDNKKVNFNQVLESHIQASIEVNFNQVLESHIQASIERISCYPVVLLVQDTTDLIRTITKGPKGLGTLKETTRSFFASYHCNHTS